MLLRAKRFSNRECTCQYSRFSTASPIASTSQINLPKTIIEQQKDLVKQVRKSDWKRRQEGSNFVDNLSLNIFSGKGGAGGVAFHREKFKAKGPPSGGTGGQGGSIYLLASTSVSSLSHLPRTIRADPGGSGLGKWLGGKRGEDVILRVPIGTIIKEIRWEVEGEMEKDRQEREEMNWAWEASKVRLAEAESREKRWDAWKKKKELAEKTGEETEAYDELEPIDVGEHKQAALEKVRRSLFIMYPQTELASHPSFLYSEHQLLSKVLQKQSAASPRKTRRRKSQISEEDDIPLYLDLIEATPISNPILLLAGGGGGLGNPSFQSTGDRSPKYATRGAEGEMLRLELEVKAGGEVGLVGMPNAGKSTILRALTSSTPRIAAYPFTTLNPHHGTCVLFNDGTFSGPKAGSIISDTVLSTETFSATSPSISRYERRKDSAVKLEEGEEWIPRIEEMRFTITDNPGLVPLSSLNVGLGHAFLRHIERCSTLIYVIDLSVEDPISALEAVRKELREYARMNGLEGQLENRIKGVIANKADLFVEFESSDSLDEDAAKRSTAAEGQRKLAELTTHVKEMEVREIEEGIRRPDDSIWVVPTSAKQRQNIASLVQKLAATVKIERARTLELIMEEDADRALEREEAIERLEAAGTSY